ncbi:MAG: FHA domain-containing protein, partial [Acidobacteriota bacterium]
MVDRDEGIRPGAEAGFNLEVLTADGTPDPRGPIALSADVVHLGRGDDCDVVLASFTVSRRHAEIRRTPKGYWLVDVGSSNGVWIGEQRVREVALQDGLEFRLGGVTLRFRLPAAGQESSAGPAAQRSETAPAVPGRPVVTAVPSTPAQPPAEAAPAPVPRTPEPSAPALPATPESGSRSDQSVT